MNHFETLIETLNHTPLGPIGAFIFGTIWGSFFNVCILRIPNEESLISRGSHCPNCDKNIPWYCNVPVLSYLWLLGKCKFCRAPISVQYPLVELGTGLLFLALFLRFNASPAFLAYCIFTGILIVVSVIDLYHRIIPDEFSLSGIVLGLLLTISLGLIPWWDSLLGVLIGGGAFLTVAVLYEKISGNEGLGGGDIKLLAMLGAWLGVKSILALILISTTLGSIVGVGLMVWKGKDMKAAIPFGPFLAIAGLCYLFWQTTINAWLFPPLNG